MSGAKQLAEGWDGALESLPEHVRTAVEDVQRAVTEHESHAYRYEVVDGELVEIRQSPGEDVRLIYRPDLTEPDTASAAE